MIAILAAGTLIIFSGTSHALPPINTAYPVVQMNSNGVFVGAATNIIQKNGIARTQDVATVASDLAIVSNLAVSGIASAAVAQASANAAMSTGAAAQVTAAAGISSNAALAQRVTAVVTNHATLAQGVLASGAAQSNLLGSAAYSNAEAFATAAEGYLAYTALQNEADPMWIEQRDEVFAGVYLAETAVQSASGEYIATVSNAASAWRNLASRTNWGWASNGKEITITSYSGPTSVDVPFMLDGLPVTTIGQEAFKDLPIVTFNGPSVRSIEMGAFFSCTLLREINIPNVTDIGGYAFTGCTSLTNISLPLVSRIGSGAFGLCTSLNSILYGGAKPFTDSGIFLDNDSTTNYVSSPTSAGWGSTFWQRPVVRLPVYGAGVLHTNLVLAVDGTTNTIIYLGLP